MADQMTAVILQGGGALGAYQAGVVEELDAHDILPDWVIGTSIGAINAAIIVGNPRGSRVEKLHAFWRAVAIQTSDWSPFDSLPWLAASGPMASAFAGLSKNTAVFRAVTQGVPGFFRPRLQAQLDVFGALPTAEAGFYDVSPLRQTLLDHVDFARINSGAVRLSVCAVDVETSEPRVFDTRIDQIGPEHIMASGALPPAFPPVMIDGRAYWDGGIYSNSPLDVLLAEDLHRDALVFLVDVWDPTEPLPTSMAAVMDRQKVIQYSGRTSAQIEMQARLEKLRQVIRSLVARLPEPNMEDAELAMLAQSGCDRTVNVIRMIMKSAPNDDQFKDADFSAASITARWAAGRADARRALAHKRWLEPVPPHSGLVIHELEQEETTV